MSGYFAIVDSSLNAEIDYRHIYLTKKQKKLQVKSFSTFPQGVENFIKIILEF